MRWKPKRQNGQKIHLLVVIVLGTASLAGCVGKKYGFPGFGAKQASTTEEEKTSVEEKVSQEKTVSDLNHVAANNPGIDPAFAHEKQGTLILPASSRKSQISLDDAFTGTPSVTNLSQSFSESGPSLELDEAFHGLLATEVGKQSEDVSPELSEYKKLVSKVDQGVSSLEALKDSLDNINSTDAGINSGREISLPAEKNDDSFERYISNQKTERPEILNRPPVPDVTEKIVELSDAGTAKTTDISKEFPWFGTQKKKREQKKSESQTPANGYGHHIRGMMTKARGLIQDNNLLDARLIAETASRLKENTQAVFSPEEITPEQILAEIAERERVRKEALLSSYHSNELQPEPHSVFTQELKKEEIIKRVSRQSSPVVIDLSKEWLNRTQTGEANGLNDIQQFERSIERPNQGATLPIISPDSNGSSLEESPTTPELNQEIVVTSYDSASKTRSRDNTWLLSDPVSKDKAETNDLNNRHAIEEEELPQQSSYLPLNLPVSEEELSQIQLSEQSLSSASVNDAPLLMGPGMSLEGNASQGSEFDEFAADFAGATTQDNLEIEQAPLLIDEAELNVQVAQSSSISTTMLSLIICGFAFATMMFVRWRR